jgi:glucosyl-dolichyl phosphate glucuronosyltransferase
MEPLVSAVICTHNRSAYLRKALQSLQAQTLAKHRYEIVVVDNASTDNTREVVDKEGGAVSNLRYIFEPELGLNHARNAGWRNARSPYIAYLDDDAVACSAWLEKIIEVFENIAPQPGCVGGKIEPIWEAPRPSWLDDEMLPYLAILDWSPSPIVLDQDQFLAGVNIAFPRSLLEGVGGFRLGLDRTGKNLLSNGDIHVQRLVRALRYDSYYDPRIVVQHHVAASRLTKEWFVQRAYWQGISDVVLNQLLVPQSRMSLLHETSRQALRLTKSMSGGYLSPRKIFWHIKGMRFDYWLDLMYETGAIRKRIALSVGVMGFTTVR